MPKNIAPEAHTESGTIPAIRKQKAMSRLSKYQRARKPPRFQPQVRDGEIILAVYAHRFLTGQQVCRLFFGSQSRANRRLKYLFHAGYLDRQPLGIGFGPNETIYTVGRNSIDFIAQRTQTDISEIKWMRRHNRVTPVHVRHTLAINDFRIALWLACMSHPTLKMDRWVDQRECRVKFYSQDDRGEEILKVFEPDGLAQIIAADNKTYSFFFEQDRGTSTNLRFRAKVERYLELSARGKIEDLFYCKLFRVLVITTSIERARNLKRVAEDAGATNFWFSWDENATPERILGPVWFKTGSNGLMALWGGNSR